MSNRAYDILKWVAQIAIPALATLVYGLAEIWGLPYGAEIVGTIVLIDTVLGIILGISTIDYKEKKDR